jgi:transcriptional regulator
MYLPRHFAEERLPVLHQAIREAGLATLVTVTPEGPMASHVPMLFDPDLGPHGTLFGHIARGNRQWRDLVAGMKALAIFPGPDFYVTPSWYPTKAETGKVVPTWNYVTVHAIGAIEFFEAPDRLHDLVSRLTHRQEAPRPAPWAVADAPSDYIAGQIKAIIGFALTIERLEGKWKLSQNRNEADRRGVIEGLEAEGAGTLAGLVAEAGKPPG